MKKTLDFGKIDYTHTGRKAYPVTVEVELKKRGGEPTFTIENGERIPTGETTPEYLELTICGDIWNTRKSDIVAGGQCLDTIREYAGQLKNRALFIELYKLWEAYHLNGMHAGTPEQEKAIKEWRKAGNSYDYTKACEMLKAAGLYEIPFTGLTVGKRYAGEPYKYGHGWVVEELPAAVVERVKQIISES